MSCPQPLHSLLKTNMVALEHGSYGYKFCLNNVCFTLLRSSRHRLCRLLYCSFDQAHNCSQIIVGTVRATVCDIATCFGILVRAGSLCRNSRIRYLCPLPLSYCALILFQTSVHSATFTYSYDPLNRLT